MEFCNVTSEFSISKTPSLKFFSNLGMTYISMLCSSSSITILKKNEIFFWNKVYNPLWIFKMCRRTSIKTTSSCITVSLTFLYELRTLLSTCKYLNPLKIKTEGSNEDLETEGVSECFDVFEWCCSDEWIPGTGVERETTSKWYILQFSTRQTFSLIIRNAPHNRLHYLI